MSIRIRKVDEEIFYERGNWSTAGLKGIAIPTYPIVIDFSGKQIFLKPGNARSPDHNFTFHTVAHRCPPGVSLHDQHNVICEFANALSWTKELPIEVVDFTGSDLPTSVGSIFETTLGFNDDFFIEYLPEPTERSVKLALAIYREGQLLNIPAYQCLSYFRILNLAYGRGGKLKQWIRDHYEKVREYWPHRLHDWMPLNSPTPKQSIENYFISSNRCAVAHASDKEPTINPNDLDDLQRMRHDLPFVKAMAAYTIEHTFLVPSTQTIFRKRRSP
ncbi:methylamine utilization protein MauJ [Maritalea myrionectae]|uniref:methylamine utilization protein MauJ n=1 Tax=Maritalea myrionectae TaxID=454601 RepID=UPI0004256FB9|nr:methylamine utilization protein MauJ [Maritalea myrionectae]